MNGTKDVIKHLPGEQLAAVKIKGQEKENEMALEISRHDGWLGHLGEV